MYNFLVILMKPSEKQVLLNLFSKLKEILSNVFSNTCLIYKISICKFTINYVI